MRPKLLAHRGRPARNQSVLDSTDGKYQIGKGTHRFPAAPGREIYRSAYSFALTVNVSFKSLPWYFVVTVALYAPPMGKLILPW